MAITLADLIYDEAVRRDWCNEFEDWAQTVNQEVGFLLVAHRRVTHTVSISIEVPRHVSRTDIMAVIEHELRRFDAEVNEL